MGYYVSIEALDRRGQYKLREGFNYDSRPSNADLDERRRTMKSRFYAAYNRSAEAIEMTVTPNPDTEEESYVG